MFSANSYDAIQHKKLRFQTGVEDVTGNICEALPDGVVRARVGRQAGAYSTPVRCSAQRKHFLGE